jgi:hypothetical protein
MNGDLRAEPKRQDVLLRTLPLPPFGLGGCPGFG